MICGSAGYAYEIQTGLGGFGMEWLLGSRQYALNGVLNGIDYTEWNPATDVHVPAKYSVKDLPDLKGKAICKKEMQKELGLPERDDVPLFAFIGRLDGQKGADLILGASRWIVEQVCGIPCHTPQVSYSVSHCSEFIVWCCDTSLGFCCCAPTSHDTDTHLIGSLYHHVFTPWMLVPPSSRLCLPFA